MTLPRSGGTPLSIPVFRRAWVGFTLSAAGDAASWVALVALCLGPARGSLPLLAALYTAPVAVGGLCAGWALDRFDRRALIIADSLVRGAVFASVPIGMIFGAPSAPHLYVVAAVYGLMKMTSLAGFPTLIPALVPDGHLAQANALEGMSFGLASLCGAGLAGVGVATVGAAPVVAADAASYLALAAALLSIRHVPRRRPSDVGPAGTRPAGARPRTGLSTVLRLVLTHRILRATTIMFALFNIGEGCLLVFLPHRAVDLGLGSGGYGYLVAVTTGGELVATAFLARRAWRRSLPVSIVVAQVLAGTVVVMLVARSTMTTLAALALLGFLSAPMTAWAQTLRMRVVPPESHGRLFALLRTAMQATPPVGAGLGALLQPHGPVITVVIVAAVMGLPALVFSPSMLAVDADGPGRAEQPTAAGGVEDVTP